MLQISLKKGFIAQISDEDADLLHYKWQVLVKPKTQTAYAFRQISHYSGGGNIYLHREILSRVLDRPLEKGEEADHVDLNKLNCQRSNLRLATRQGNCQNTLKRAGYTSRYKGVGWNSQKLKWQASIRIPAEKGRGKAKHLGFFVDEADAARAYDRAAEKLFGEFALTNKMLGLL